MKRLLIINNVPTPYRAFMFAKLHEHGAACGVDVSVAFQARRDRWQVAKPEDIEMNFPHGISRGLWRHSAPGGDLFTYTTLNPDILRDVSSGRFDYVLMSALQSVTGWLASLSPSGRTLKLLWSESNLLSTTHRNWLARRFKALLVSRYPALACPGRRAIEYVCDLAPQMASRPVLYLPNVVDTTLFKQRIAQLRGQREAIRSELGVSDDCLMVLGIGRHAASKGFAGLIEAAAHVQGRYRLMLVGDGPLHQDWIARVGQLGVADRVVLPGTFPPQQLVRLMAAADFFVHPALSDPSPLVCVEACYAGLPVAISEQTGNAPETVVDGVNGFSFDSYDPAAVVDALRRIVATTPEQRRRMSAASVTLADQHFDPDTVCRRFFADLENIPRKLGVCV